jgi:hypothetical protein
VRRHAYQVVSIAGSMSGLGQTRHPSQVCRAWAVQA